MIVISYLKINKKPKVSYIARILSLYICACITWRQYNVIICTWIRTDTDVPMSATEYIHVCIS